MARAIASGSGSSVSAVNLVVPFYHHGIYIGGKIVIDYNDKSKINRTSLLQLKAGKSLFRVTNKGGPKPLKPEAVVKRAKRRKILAVIMSKETTANTLRRIVNMEYGFC